MVSSRVVVVPKGDRFDRDLARSAERLGLGGLHFVSSDLFFIGGDDASRADQIAEHLLDDPLLRDLTIESSGDSPERAGASESGVVVIETARRKGVTDRVAAQLVDSAAALGLSVVAATGARYEIRGLEHHDVSLIRRLVDNLLANPVVDDWSYGSVRPALSDDGPSPSDPGSEPVESVAIRGLDADDLERLNRERGLALDLEEMVIIRDWFEEIGREPTDAELETLAQTWSEHCAHKTFTASIRLEDAEGRIVDASETSLLQRLRASTSLVVDDQRSRDGRTVVVSAFDGNAGIVEFTGVPRLAVKVETHNHPSAVEPFGGANTGVGGVVRDVLAAPADPIALTNVLCFGPRNIDVDDVPVGVLHPSIVEDGVVAGVADYGNKIGVPTVSGAVFHHEGFVGNPLVFCGCVGRVLRGQSKLGRPRAGDRVVVIGGATGRDGIKGATFSSMTMDATTGQVAGASVQIGDPIVERLVGEVLVDLLDCDDPPCSAITDCGAGGLSSAVGEMADGVGAIVGLEKVPRKYAGLAPWEVWLSEAQERMVLAVDPDRLDEVVEACRRRGVQWADIGSFTGDGRLRVLNHSTVVVDLPTDFLHDGRPRRRMTARLRASGDATTSKRIVADHTEVLMMLLSHPDIASKEAVIRQYDHEVKGATVVGPMAGPRQVGPSDGVVVADPTAPSGFAVAVGVNPTLGLVDCRAMAWSVVDEAIRNVVAVGADPRQVALLDNFSWGDPRDAETLGDLVVAVDGCIEAAHDFLAPFVSGKDSLNNEYEGVDGVRRSIPPTLVITAIARIPDADTVVSTAFTTPGRRIVMLGQTHDELRGSHLDLILGRDHGGVPPARDPAAPRRYEGVHDLIRNRVISMAHDPSEGGLIVALAESALGGGLGVDVDLTEVHADVTVALYSQSNGRMIVEIDPSDLELVRSTIDHVIDIGVVSEAPGLRVRHSGAELIDVSVDDLHEWWTSKVTP